MKSLSGTSIEELEKSTGILYVSKLSLEEWLDLLKNPLDDLKFQDYAFPTEKHRDQYISTIQDRTEEEILLLLGHFLIHSGSLGADERHLEGLERANKENPELFERMIAKQY